jgi:hypothetical protein
MGRHGATLAVSETGIGEAVSARMKAENGVLIATQMYRHPDDLRAALGLSSDVSLRQLAERAAAAARESAGAAVGVAIVSDPDKDEHHTDAEEWSAIAVCTEAQTRSRSYGFGGQSEIARQWGSTWAMSMAWRMVREKFDDVR